MKLTKKLIRCGKYFPDDKGNRNIYRVSIINNGKRCSFLFGDSMQNTDKCEELKDHDVLSCCKSDYYITKEQYPTLKDFCNGFGYNEDSRTAEKTYKACLRQAERLHRVFTEEEIENFPE